MANWEKSLIKPNFARELGHAGYSAPSSNRRFFKQLLSQSCNLYQKDLLAHYGCVNAIEFSPFDDLLASGGDDRRLLLWNIHSVLDNDPSPTVMKGEHSSNIFCIAFTNNQKTVLSAGNDEQVLLHDIETGRTLDIFLHTSALYGISVNPTNDNVFASASDDGKVVIWDKREPSYIAPFCVARYKAPFYSVVYNPVEPTLLATANNKYGVALWDIRMPFKCCLLKYGGNNANQSAMSIRFNAFGSKILALRRRLPPVLYDIHSGDAIHEFDSPGYYNSCTMKSCCFAGYNDEYILSGSDDFKLYMWKIPSDSTKFVKNAHMVLKGHRSIVNQVRFNSSNFLLASSGVEKVVKLWSVFPMPGSKGDLNEEIKMAESRKFYSPEDYINLIISSGVFMTHDYSHHSVNEDARMMAFFDSLVQRDIEGWASDSTDSFTQDSHNWEIANVTSSDSSSSDTDSSSSGSSKGRGSCKKSKLKTEQSKGINELANEVNMEISDILTQRIAIKKKELNKQTSRLSDMNKKLKKKSRKMKNSKKSKKRILSTSSSSDEDNIERVHQSSDSAPQRGFLTLDSILGPPVWCRVTDDSDSSNNDLRELRIKRSHVLVSTSGTDTDSSAHGQAKILKLKKLSNEAGPTISSDNPSCSTSSNMNIPDADNVVNSVNQTSSSANTSNPGPSTSSNVTWEEFKRFKNKVKKVSRQYRKHQPSSSESSD